MFSKNIIDKVSYIIIAYKNTFKVVTRRVNNVYFNTSTHNLTHNVKIIYHNKSFKYIF